ncbi:MAG: PhzF family phenazine biosynthesis protein [Myxococcales bacterium]|nr:PhzF family phenazine biosynthesis protein [Myxococcales bacterium]
MHALPARLPLFQVNAFTGPHAPLGTPGALTGNPAAVCPLERWLPDPVLAAIAAENDLSETAFFVPQAGGAAAPFALRWFTPAVEVDLCGHATLASAAVILRELEPARREVSFDSASGVLGVRREGAGVDELLALDFPVRPASPAASGAQELLAGALGARPEAVLAVAHESTAAVRGYLCVYPDEASVRALRPDMGALVERVHARVLATAPGERVDFVSRFFAPDAGVPEDPVTGSAHCTLVPYWAARLGRRELHAWQVSARGGELFCSLLGAERVRIAGRARLYLRGEIALV